MTDNTSTSCSERQAIPTSAKPTADDGRSLPRLLPVAAVTR
jgi:hypothetical protein